MLRVLADGPSHRLRRDPLPRDLDPFLYHFALDPIECLNCPLNIPLLVEPLMRQQQRLDPLRPLAAAACLC